MDDLLSEFLTETSESLSTLDVELVKLEQNPNDPDILSNIFRLVHTIKGTCGFLGLPRLEAVAHAGENVLGKIRDGELVVTPPAVTLVLESIDTIKYLLSELEQNETEPDGKQMLHRLWIVLHRQSPSLRTKMLCRHSLTPPRLIRKLTKPRRSQSRQHRRLRHRLLRNRRLWHRPRPPRPKHPKLKPHVARPRKALLRPRRFVSTSNCLKT